MSKTREIRRPYKWGNLTIENVPHLQIIGTIYSAGKETILSENTRTNLSRIRAYMLVHDKNTGDYEELLQESTKSEYEKIQKPKQPQQKEETIKESTIQQEHIRNLLILTLQHPSLPIVPMVDGELIGYDYAYYMGVWGEPEIDEVYHEDERIYFKSTDQDELTEKYVEEIHSIENPRDQEVSDGQEKDIIERAVQTVENLPWEKVITVKIHTPR